MDKMEEIRAVGYSTNTFFEEVFNNELEELLTLEEQKVLLTYYCNSSLIHLYNCYCSDNHYEEIIEYVPNIKDLIKPYFKDNDLNYQLINELIEINPNNYVYYYIDSMNKITFMTEKQTMNYVKDFLLDDIDIVYDDIREYFIE